MPTEIYSVKSIAKGHLYIMPCPGHGHVVQDLKYLHNMGINKVISLLEEDEARAYGLENEREICAAFGMEFIQFPITDRQTPSNPAQFRLLVNQLYAELCSGKHIAIHCFAGIGRTGLLSGSILIRHGMTPSQAVDLLSDTRKAHVPQTSAQYHYLLDFDGGQEHHPLSTDHKKSGKWLSRWLSPA